jgi:hypothetical protein
MHTYIIFNLIKDSFFVFLQKEVKNVLQDIGRNGDSSFTRSIRSMLAELPDPALPTDSTWMSVLMLCMTTVVVAWPPSDLFLQQQNQPP